MFCASFRRADGFSDWGLGGGLGVIGRDGDVICLFGIVREDSLGWGVCEGRIVKPELVARLRLTHSMSQGFLKVKEVGSYLPLLRVV